MSDKEALEALAHWFGTRSFRVRDIAEDRVDRIINLLGLPHNRSSLVLRTYVGRWLSSNEGLEVTNQEGRRYRLVVLEPADDSKPGVYQIQSR